MRSGKASWRAPELGEPGTIGLPQGELDYFDSGGEGPAVVFVHGALVNANLWRHVVAALRPECRCVALDLPLGSHLRPMPKQADLSPPALADLIADAIEALGLTEVTLVGNDTGGALCQLVATRRPERLGRLALTSCDAFDNFPPRAIRPFLPLMRLPGVIWFSLAPLFLPPVRNRTTKLMRLTKGRVDPPAAAAYSLPALRDRGVRRDVKKAMAGMDPGLTEAAAELFPQFDRPVLIAWSREDKFFPAAHAERLAESFPEARLEWIEDAYTFSPEDQPERLAELLGSFSARVVSA